ncbi:Protein of unknown function [Bacillus toyonensis]|nr:Protein of unknown function [Bacillus toyonensis]
MSLYIYVIPSAFRNKTGGSLARLGFFLVLATDEITN